MPKKSASREPSRKRSSKPSDGSNGSVTAPVGASRQSREETTARILDAAEELFSRRGPASVTVRDIASAAGVTHPLIHQYLGSKADILAAVVERGAPRRLQIIAEHPDLREVMPLLAADTLDRKVHSRSVVRAAMDGVDYADFEQRLASGRAIMAVAIESAERESRPPAPGAMDPDIVLAAATALLYGWVATGGWLSQVFRLSERDPAEVRRQLIDICLHVTDLVFVPPEGPQTRWDSGSEG